MQVSFFLKMTTISSKCKFWLCGWHNNIVWWTIIRENVKARNRTTVAWPGLVWGHSVTIYGWFLLWIQKLPSLRGTSVCQRIPQVKFVIQYEALAKLCVWDIWDQMPWDEQLPFSKETLWAVLLSHTTSERNWYLPTFLWNDTFMLNISPHSKGI